MRDLDNWITGHYGEDYFKDEDDSMDDKQDIVVTMQISLTDKGEAVTLAEFLQELLDMMHIEGVVSYTNEDKNNESQEPGTMQER